MPEGWVFLSGARKERSKNDERKVILSFALHNVIFYDNIIDEVRTWMNCMDGKKLLPSL